jgi:hypothetical protein
MKDDVATLALCEALGVAGFVDFVAGGACLLLALRGK